MATVPTAVFTLLSVLYAHGQLQTPWKELLKGPTHPSQEAPLYESAIFDAIDIPLCYAWEQSAATRDILSYKSDIWTWNWR